jgi:hypothetical protein
MTSIEFAIWLQGYFDITVTYGLNDQQVNLIKEKLATVKDQPKKCCSSERGGHNDR